MLTPWKKSYDQPRQHIKKQRHYFADKGLYSQSYGFSSSHVWMWELEYKESWALKNWWVRTVVLEKTLESSLDCKDIKPVNPKGKWKVKVIQSHPTLCDPIDYTVHGILQARILGWVACPFSRGSSQPRDRAQASSIAGGFFTSWHKGILEWVSYPFPSELNQGLLHCRILYQLRYQGNPSERLRMYKSAQFLIDKYTH